MKIHRRDAGAGTDSASQVSVTPVAVRAGRSLTALAAEPPAAAAVSPQSPPQSPQRSLLWPADPRSPADPPSLRWLSAATAPPRNDAVYYRVCCRLKRYLRDARKPLIVVVADSADSPLLQQATAAYGNSSPLRAATNLVLAVSRPPQPAGDEEPDAAEPEAARKSLLLAIDRYDLYGDAALFAPQDGGEELVELLRVARDRRGVLVVAESGAAVPIEGGGWLSNEAWNPTHGWAPDAASAGWALELLSSDLGVPVVPVLSGETDDLADRCGSILVDPQSWAELSRETQQLAADRRWQLYRSGYAALGRRLLESRRRRNARPSGGPFTGGAYPALETMLPAAGRPRSLAGLRLADVADGVDAGAAAAG